MGSANSGRRLLLVHAHPDDESIGTGATMARYAAEGARVTLVTCTLGELGEIIPPPLAHLAAEREDWLGEYRIGELAAACAELGVTDHRFLGGPGRWRDSGMMDTEANPGTTTAAAGTAPGNVRDTRRGSGRFVLTVAVIVCAVSLEELDLGVRGPLHIVGLCAAMVGSSRHPSFLLMD